MNRLNCLLFFLLSILIGAHLHAAPIEFYLEKDIKNLTDSLRVSEVLEQCHIQVQKTKIESGHWGLVETDKSAHVEPHKNCQYVIRLNENLQNIENKLTLMHEFVHIIRHQYNPQEVVWLDEGLAQLIEAEYIQLFPHDKNQRLQDSNQVHLSSSREEYQPKSKAYATSYFFMKYLYSRFGGIELLRELIQSPHSGWDNIENSIRKLKQKKLISISESFLNRQSIWTHFVFAMTLNTTKYADYGLFLLDQKFQNIPVKKLSDLFLDHGLSVFLNCTDAKALVFNAKTKYEQQVLQKITESLSQNGILYAVQLGVTFKVKRIKSNLDLSEITDLETYSFILMNTF